MILLHEQLSGYSKGLEYACGLEGRLQAEWGARLAQARDSALLRHQQALKDWELYERAREANDQKRLRLWKAGEDEKEQRLQARRALWQKRVDDIERRHKARHAAWLAAVLPAAQRAVNRLWFFTLVLFILGGASYRLITPLPLDWEGGEIIQMIPWMIWLGGAILAVWAFYEQARLRQLSRQGPERPPLPPEPQREQAARRPRPEPSIPMPALRKMPHLDLQNRWLLAINRKSFDLPDLAPETHGKPGETDLFLFFAENLPDEYLALRNLLLRRSLDLDLTLIGPTGIWLLDSKYWSGWICFGSQGWERDKEPSDEEEQEMPDDLGWGNQKKFAIQALRRSGLPFDWEEIVRGGIAFTHQDCTLEIGQDCPVMAGLAEDWLQAVQETAPVPRLSLEVCLKIADALVGYSAKPRLEQIPGFQTTPSSTFAGQAYAEIAQEIQEYLDWPAG